MDLGTKFYIAGLLLGHVAVALLFIRTGIDLHREAKYYERERKRYAREQAEYAKRSSVK